MDNALKSMNALDYKAFRKSLCEVVIIGWYHPGSDGPKAGKVFDKPHKDMIKDNTFDDGNVGYSTGVLYRNPSSEECSNKKATVSAIDRMSKSRHQRLWLPETKEFLDYIVKNPEGFMPGDLLEVPNEVLYYAEFAEADKARRGSSDDDDYTDDVA